MDGRGDRGYYVPLCELIYANKDHSFNWLFQAVWSWVRAWTLRTLEKAGERVVDVQGDDDEMEEAPPQPTATTATDS